MRPIFSLHRIALLLLLFLAPLGSLLTAAEPFYVELLADGREAYEEGEYERAKKYLPLACFGLLEDPELLAEGLAYLTLARQETDFDHTDLLLNLERLVETEERYGAYEDANLPDEVRERIEVLLAEKIPPEQLFAVSAFADLARAELQRRVGRMPLEERRSSLEMHLAAEPDDPGWLVLAAELELESNQPALALESLLRILGGEPLEDEEIRSSATCLRGRALGRLGRCDEAIEDLPTCGSVLAKPALLETTLSCLVKLQRWDAAGELVNSLPKEIRKGDAIKPLVDQVRRSGR